MHPSRPHARGLQATIVDLLPVALAILSVMQPDVAAGAAPARRSWVIAPPAPWVRDLPPPSRAPAARADAASSKVYRLLDHQVRVSDSVVEYSRLAWTVLSTEGVQSASEVQIDFDPSYQRLVIHHVRLLRDGRDVFSFRSSDVRVIQPEADLDEQIYSGELTAVIFLRDLRPGDTLDYAYSLEGANPILNGGYEDVLWLRYAAPVESLRHVVSVPAATRLHIAARNTTLAPTVAAAGNWRSYTWEARDVSAQVVDEDEPGWFDPDPRVLVSTFGSWEDVARWAAGLFEGGISPAPEIRQQADRWRPAAGGQLAAAAEAVRFVQDEVRYLGIELGPGSHRPHPPAQVLRQRFGDCKDKSLLLVALLRELGADAAPALVDTTRGRGLDDEPPSAFAFDHAIVQIRLGGRVLWVDATESGKGGPIEDWDPPGYERALVLRPDVDRLTVIERPARTEPLIEVEETYTLGEPGQPVRLEVVTTYRRDEADEMRRTLATTPRQDLAREYIDYFAREFTEITPQGEPTSRDDRARNIVTVSESYEIRTFWKDGERELFGWQVEDLMPPSAASTRTAPLAVPHPVHVVHRITLRSPRPFKVAGRGETIASGAFEFSSRLSAEGRVLRLAFDYRSRADSVMPDDIKTHQQAAERVMDELSFVLADDLTESGVDPGARPWAAIALLGVVAAGAGAAYVLMRWRRRTPAA